MCAKQLPADHCYACDMYICGDRQNQKENPWANHITAEESKWYTNQGDYNVVREP